METAETNEQQTVTETSTQSGAGVNEEVTDANSTSEDQAEASKAAVDPNILRMKQDMLKYKDEANELKEKLKQREMDELKKQENWQAYAETREKEAIEHKERADRLEKNIVYDKKLSAVEKAALASGLRKEALADLELMDFLHVDIETTSTGRVNVLNVEAEVDRIKRERPHWFGGKKASINSGDPEVVSASGPLTHEAIAKIEAAAKKSGDYAPYYKAIAQFRAQNKR